MGSLLIEAIPASMGTNNNTSHPIKNVLFSLNINETKTDICLSSFSNMIFITISQNQKFNTWIKASQADGVILDEPCFNIDTLLGNNNEKLYTIYARQLIENISASSKKQLLLSISVTDKSKETFRAILSAIDQNKIW
ncbi:hypothetical protein CYY_010163 [Polysphondylium violaceum]|uniref:Proteasome assembly chaperone 3 n=1 Tax=Polysphondylium violaceum TaxID=133409 RepID=A0A8J4PL18_9MYCE|nr:hypothetical protein CYY_010163 [Polysphondylium violaceum]